MRFQANRLINFSRRMVLRALVGAAILWINPLLAAEPAVTFGESSAVVKTADGDHRFTVEMAMTDAQRSLGLMFRQELAPDRGMLFDFQRPTYISMWMRNTYISLDMLFIGTDGRINYIREYATPHSQETIEAPGRNRAVLEVAAGTVARLNIRVGDHVAHAMFQ